MLCITSVERMICSAVYRYCSISRSTCSLRFWVMVTLSIIASDRLEVLRLRLSLRDSSAIEDWVGILLNLVRDKLPRLVIQTTHGVAR